MDHSRFDNITRVLSSRSRRSIVRLLSAGTLAVVWEGLGGADRQGVEAKCKKPCGPCRACKKGKCKKKKPDGTRCGLGGHCRNGQCCTPTCDGKTCGEDNGCGGKCVRDEGCAAGQRCSIQGVCQDSPSCSPGLGQCSASDPVACHTCCPGGAGDDGCPGNQVCGNGAVRCECPAGMSIISGCGTTTCVCNATCLPCNPPFGCCDGQCANLQGCGPATNGCNGHQNCGTCGNHCSESQTCCSGTCVPLTTPENCGWCGAKCPAGTQCCGPGNCQPTCP
jgi:hypothetical protein